MEPTTKLLTPKEVAELLNVPVSWVYSHASGNGERIPGFRIGRLLRFKQDEVVAWYERHPLDRQEPSGTQPGDQSQRPPGQ